MREVSKEVFYARIGPMNVHPRPEAHETFWETPTRQLIGKSTPGYKSEGEKRYFLADNGTTQ